MSFPVHVWSSLGESQRSTLLSRPSPERQGVRETVAAILAGVRRDGDLAVRAFSEQFDGTAADPLRVPREQLESAARQCTPGLLSALDSAAKRIGVFHQAGRPRDYQAETAPGLVCEARYLPMSPVGLYVPGGSAPLVSTVLMLAIPARLAGCERVVLCTPPGADGRINPALLAAAHRCGIEEIYAVGGAQAIAAMAYGTQTIPRCVKIFGPGNAWVTEAKRQAAASPDGAAQDLPAGPSEVLIIADQGADIEAVCWDLLSQAEHGPDSQSILISNDTAVLVSVAERISVLARSLPRARILDESLGFLRLIRVNSLDEALEISNRYAPEHLILNCDKAHERSTAVTHAGSVFIGAWTPESLGDYCSGTNHVLPTNGYARAYGGLSVIDFMRRMTLQTASREGLATAGPDALEMSALEGLDAHRMAVQHRLDSQ
ncbi:MAG: histidinol dehydrogenase [Gammaproteobacteria bacterium]|nr:histidinol dehydrogenase [Gammaproteobacteria bacterium]